MLCLSKIVRKHAEHRMPTSSRLSANGRLFSKVFSQATGRSAPVTTCHTILEILPKVPTNWHFLGLNVEISIGLKY
jgi:hypothetical protein